MEHFQYWKWLALSNLTASMHSDITDALTSAGLSHILGMRHGCFSCLIILAKKSSPPSPSLTFLMWMCCWIITGPVFTLFTYQSSSAPLGWIMNHRFSSSQPEAASQSSHPVPVCRLFTFPCSFAHSKCHLCLSISGRADAYMSQLSEFSLWTLESLTVWARRCTLPPDVRVSIY